MFSTENYWDGQFDGRTKNPLEDHNEGHVD